MRCLEFGGIKEERVWKEKARSSVLRTSEVYIGATIELRVVFDKKPFFDGRNKDK